MPHRTPWGTRVLRSLGLVFGDIGTSPIYTLTVVLALTDPTAGHVVGILSLIFWTLILLGPMGGWGGASRTKAAVEVPTGGGKELKSNLL